MVGGDVADGVHEAEKLLAVHDEMVVHGLQPSLFAAECAHVGDALQTLGDEGECSLRQGSRMVCKDDQLWLLQ